MEGERGREIYRECMRNHAAPLGAYAADGCGEFTPDDTKPGGYHCAACSCHRNFHRKVVVDCSGDSRGRGFSPATEERMEGRRKPRTKFSAEQKEKMSVFAEKIGWRIQRREVEGGEDQLGRFCKEVGVSRQIFKVWMHNHKSSSSASSSKGNAVVSEDTK